MKDILSIVNEDSLRDRKQYYEHDADLSLEYKDFTIEIDESKSLIRIYDDTHNKSVKFWYKDEVIQAFNNGETTLEEANIFNL